MEVIFTTLAVVLALLAWVFIVPTAIVGVGAVLAMLYWDETLGTTRNRVVAILSPIPLFGVVLILGWVSRVLINA